MNDQPDRPKRLLARDVIKYSVANKPQDLRFPYAPGDWLRVFRSRCDRCAAPDVLGSRLGVSGKTVVRWESGQSTPHEADLESLAQVLELSLTQRAFLFRAFTTVRETHAPDAGLFQEQARKLLSGPFPALLMDGLYYVRARNTFATAMFYPRGGPEGPQAHFLRRILSRPAMNGIDDGRRRQMERSHWLQLVWLATAAFCGLPAYARMLDELSELPGFRESWVRAAVESGDSQLGGAPLNIDRDGQSYRVYVSQVDFPPIYHLREYVPTNDAARARVEELRSEVPHQVDVNPVVHWSQA
jgi:transcriptional regulator with XRE-family HTH domain